MLNWVFLLSKGGRHRRNTTGNDPGGAKAKTMHVGPYQEMAAAYEALTQFIKDQGREPSGVAYEYYLDPPEVPDGENPHSNCISFKVININGKT